MKHLSLCAAACFAAFVLAVSGPGLAQAEPEAPVLILADGPQGPEKSVLDDALLAGAALMSTLTAHAVTVNVYSRDPAGAGFRQGTDRLDRLEETLVYLSDVLNEAGEFDLMLAPSESDGTGALAQGGTLWGTPAGNGAVFRRLTEGVKPFAGYAEMVIVFDWGWNWNTSLNPPAANQVDLRSTLLHQMTHGLGFASFIGASGTSVVGMSIYSNFDYCLAAGTPPTFLINAGLFVGDPATLTSGAVVFHGPAAAAALGDTWPSVYSPSPFVPGSSLQHWAQGAVPGGAVMDPAYLPGEMKRAYSGVDLGALRDIGWVDATASPNYGGCLLSSVTLLNPLEGSLIGSESPVVVACSADVLFNTSSDCLPTKNVRVTYFVNGESRAVSTDYDSGFPGELFLSSGIWTLRVTAEKIDGVGEAVSFEKTIQVEIRDDVPPELVLLGNLTEEWDCGEPYVDPGWVATDNMDGDITGRVSVDGQVNVLLLGDYTLQYSVSDEAGNASQTLVRSVRVRDIKPPSIILLGAEVLPVSEGTAFAEPGWLSSDLCAGDLSGEVSVSGSVNTARAGVYPLIYTVADPSGNSADPATRHVVVQSETERLSVPDVRGLPQDVASEIISALRLAVGSIQRAYSDSISMACVIQQTPAPGTLSYIGAPVNMIVSMGPLPQGNIQVPSVVGFTQSAAADALEEVGLALGAVTESYSASFPEGHVISQAPPALAMVAGGVLVSVVISKGFPPPSVPDVIGLSQAAAGAAIAMAGFSVGESSEIHSRTVAIGLVAGQSPAAGTEAARGSAVSLQISKGADPSDVEAVRQTLAASFEEADTNGDDVLTYEEASAVCPDLTRLIFDMLDTNGGGVLDRRELGLGDEGCGFGCSKARRTSEWIKSSMGDVFLGALTLVALIHLKRGGLP